MIVGVGLEAGILGHGVAGAGLGDTWQFTVTHDAGIGILIVKILQQFEEGMFLFLSTSVIRLAFLVQTSFVADAE